METGKLADFVLLDKDLFSIDPHDIWQLQPTAVVVDGQVVQGSL
ncbi:MAG: amidohydrolase family protein [Pseudomonadota bacterium]